MQLLSTGSWGGGINWEIFGSQNMPPAELITAVFCVAIIEGEVVLARSKRGWGLLGGHIEDNESQKDALVREAREEGGFTPLEVQMFAYRKVTATKPVQHQDASKHYPFPVSYLVYYWATTDRPLIKPIGREIIKAGSFALEDIKSLNTPDLPIVELGYKSYLRHTSP